MSDNTPVDTPVTPVQLTRSPGFQYLFTNHIRVRLSPGDITIAFSYVDEPAGMPLQTEMMAVGMSALQARRLSVLLNEMLKAYEETFGPIPLEPASGVAVDGPKIMCRVEEAMKGYKSG